jgi:hypothetical protein
MPLDFDAIREAAGVPKGAAYTQEHVKKMFDVLVDQITAAAHAPLGQIVKERLLADKLAKAIEQAREDFSVEPTDALVDALEAYRKGRGK